MDDAHQQPEAPTAAQQAVHSISHRMHHRPESPFAPSDLLPQDGYAPFPKRPASDFRPSFEDNPELVFGAPSGGPMDGRDSMSPDSVFERADDGREEQDTDPTTRHSDEQEQDSYDLKAPPPNKMHTNVEALSTRFFSNDHLDLILRDQHAAPRFTQFLEQFRPQYTSTLQQYIEIRKAALAVDYANAIASQIPPAQGEAQTLAAPIDEAFDAKARRIATELVEDALPAYLTHRLTMVVTDTLVKTITGNTIPAMQDLIPNLAEVFCISDPSLPDNPIVYASEEFFNTTQYSLDYTVGRNCRFLQGPRTSESTVRRMADALSAGEELCETILNYRRDGTPFMNLLLLAPMYDNKGDVKYFLGAQVDVSPLIEGGKGLDSFSRLLSEDRAKGRYNTAETESDPMHLLGELGQMLSEPEKDFVLNRIKQPSHVSSGRSTPVRQQQSQPKRPTNRRIFSMDDADEVRKFQPLYPDPSLGRSGRLPGVYRNYLLVRPYPSLRITFTSPTLRIPGLLQTKLLDRIGGPENLRQNILAALKQGTSVTAKVPWVTNLKNKPGSINGGLGNGDTDRVDNSEKGKPRWLHCTPLIGSDEKVGVWMVVLVEEEEVTGLLNRQDSARLSHTRQSSIRRDDGRQDSRRRPNGNGGPSWFGAGEERAKTPSVMYADYMRTSKDTNGRGGGERPGTAGSWGVTESEAERREVDGHFRDF